MHLRHIVLTTIVLCLLLPVPLAAQSWQKKKGDTSYSFTLFPLYQFDTKLSGGGEYSVNRYFFDFKVDHQASDDTAIGVGLLYDYEKWDFTGASGFSNVPWGDVNRAGLDFKFQYSGYDNWSFMFLPSAQWSWESGADLSDSGMYGGVLAASYAFSPRLVLGIGGGLFTGLEDTRGYPFILVRWQITDALLLANPFRPGPTGPAGLELSYSINRQWEIAAGGAWRSFRFRLDDTAPARKGIAQVDLIPAWGRVSMRLGPRFVFDLYGGYFFDGTLQLDDSNGNRIGSVDQDPAPFGALTFTARF